MCSTSPVRDHAADWPAGSRPGPPRTGGVRNQCVAERAHDRWCRLARPPARCSYLPSTEWMSTRCSGCSSAISDPQAASMRIEEGQRFEGDLRGPATAASTLAHRREKLSIAVAATRRGCRLGRSLSRAPDACSPCGVRTVVHRAARERPPGMPPCALVLPDEASRSGSPTTLW